jgi:hypothetical protein
MLTPTDFTGYYRIAQDAKSNAELAVYIEKYEKKYLVDLFGYELYLLFIADLTAVAPIVPQSPRFLTVFNELKYSETAPGEWCFIPWDAAYTKSMSSKYKKSKEPTLSEGILKMLKGFIFYEFVNGYSVQVAQTGTVESKNENSDKLAGARNIGLIESRYNDAVTSFKVIRNYMKANADTYPEYDGESKEFVSFGGAI